MTIQANPLTPHAASKLLAAGCLSCFALLFAGCPLSNPKPNQPQPTAETATTSTAESSTAATSTQTAANTTSGPKSQVTETQVTETQVIETQQADSKSPEPPQTDPPQTDPPQTWSIQRIIALQSTGPRIIDILANIDGRSLDEAATAATQQVITYIEKELPRPWTWEKLLDHPLIRSGWLGNLTPDAQQRDQLINMYNRNGDDQVDDAEIAPFLSRGLARTTAFKFSNIGYAPGTILDGSPWQQLDANNDTLLDPSEIASIANRLARYDLNADHVLTLAEIRAERMAAQADMTSKSPDMLMADSTLTVNPTDKPAQIAGELVNKYSLLGLINRVSWPDWTDVQWSEFDSNADGSLSKSELERITTTPPNLSLKISFHQAASGEAHIQAQTATHENTAHPDFARADLIWSSRLKSSGQASSQSFSIAVSVLDSYTEANRFVLRNQLTAALNNPQLASFIRTQLQLSENAFEVLDTDRDSQLSDEEFDRVWIWMSAIRGNRILARWMLADTSWFQIADADADGRLTEIEMQKFVSGLPALDLDQDDVLTPRELPTAVRLEIARTDSRLAFNAPPNAESQSSDAGWFAASDTNSDGSLSSIEFLGSDEDFRTYDVDRDGFISQPEAYKTAPRDVQ